MALSFTGYLPSASSAIATETARAIAAEALLAPLASPSLSGTPTAPTPSPGDNDTSIATTAFSVVAVTAEATRAIASEAAETARAMVAEALLAPKASPTFTGTVTIPGGASISGFAPLASPTLTGTPAAPTAAQSTSTTQIATTAFARTGTVTNDSAAAGKLGEYISSTVLIGAAVALTSPTNANVTSISLTAGDWDVSGNVCFTANGATTATLFIGGIGSTSATFPTAPGGGAQVSLANNYGAGLASPTFPVGTTRISLASTTTIYLVAASIFAVNTMAAYGFIGARRAR